MVTTKNGDIAEIEEYKNIPIYHTVLMAMLLEYNHTVLLCMDTIYPGSPEPILKVNIVKSSKRDQ